MKLITNLLNTSLIKADSEAEANVLKNFNLQSNFSNNFGKELLNLMRGHRLQMYLTLPRAFPISIVFRAIWGKGGDLGQS